MKKIIYLLMGLLLCVSCSKNEEEVEKEPEKPVTPATPEEPSEGDNKRSPEAAKLLDYLKNIYGTKNTLGSLR